MAEVIGDTSHLHSTETPFTIVVELRGSSGSGSFTVSEKLKTRVSAHSLVRLVGPVRAKITCPPAADKAATLRLAAIPSKFPVAPSTSAQVATVPGAILSRDSLYGGSVPVDVLLGPEISNTIKPAQIIGSEPKFVYHYEVTGGETSTVCLLELSGELHVEGVGFIQTW